MSEPTRLKVGDLVRDVYTGNTGRVVVMDDDLNRCTADLGVYIMTGCGSWFELAPPDAESSR